MCAEKSDFDHSDNIHQSFRSHPIRQSLQVPQGHSIKPTRLTKSHNYGHSGRNGVALPTTAVIPEAEEEEDVNSQPQYVKNKCSSLSRGSKRASQTSRFSVTSKQSGDSSVTVDVGHVNASFDAGSENNLQSFRSTRHSSSRSSIPSLQVQKEQYWCFSKWSRWEKRLCLCVIILAVVVVGLLAAVAVLTIVYSGHSVSTLSW